MRADTLRGHLAGLVLSVLEPGPLHGYGVAETLRVRSGGAITVPSGTVYPALYRLERLGLVSSAWGTVSGRRRRVYQLTPAGRTALQRERCQWEEFSTTIDAVLGAAP